MIFTTTKRNQLFSKVVGLFIAFIYCYQILIPFKMDAASNYFFLIQEIRTNLYQIIVLRSFWSHNKSFWFCTQVSRKFPTNPSRPRATAKLRQVVGRGGIPPVVPKVPLKAPFCPTYPFKNAPPSQHTGFPKFWALCKKCHGVPCFPLMAQFWSGTSFLKSL